ncbi:hypothetical protein CR194_06775 [Salipaludibacillus keqinensis]|uniref:Core domain-containing protein n=1 Tax=Salipaludibacillus keqinensis TaxID=2045207 RepID=A0A323TRN8_9BACI|nr:iron-sulfur cluster biosynthesis family protein [Salipaludibacillus keqinensis]PYZ95213.1 hypothetical protein CR194_06775 [Salipaludibacillus keqinensis]
MKFTITDQAIDFYKNELNLTDGDSLSFFVRIGGVGSGGFSAGLYLGIPDHDYISLQKRGLNFCVAEDDQWYFDGMIIDYNEDYGEVTFENKRIEDVTNPS